MSVIAEMERKSTAHAFAALVLRAHARPLRRERAQLIVASARATACGRVHEQRSIPERYAFAPRIGASRPADRTVRQSRSHNPLQPASHIDLAHIMAACFQ